MVYCSGDLRFYLSALEEERSKIHVFRRELPLCYEVVNQTIQAWKKKLIEKDGRAGDQPILEELMPPRADDVVGEEDDDDGEEEEEETKSGWLRSARLWNPIPDLNTQQDHGEDPRAVLPEKPPSSAAEATTSPERRQVQQRRDNPKALGKQPQRKQRRCWSDELHHRFLKVLQELGGSHAATPKHIKERMKVDGLTNDEIKSHLQKYRLHERRSPSIQHDDNPAQAQSQAKPQLVIVGGIWMPPSDSQQ